MRDLFQFLKVVVLSVFVSLLVGACGGGNSTKGGVDGGNNTCVSDCGGGSNTEVGPVTNLHAERVANPATGGEVVSLSWNTALNAREYLITRVKWEELFLDDRLERVGFEEEYLGSFSVTYYQDILPENYTLIHAFVRYKLTAVGLSDEYGNKEYGPEISIVTMPNNVEDPQVVEDPTQIENYFGEGDEVTILNILGQGGMRANWHGLCNDGSTRDVQIQIAEKPTAPENGYTIVFFLRVVAISDWEIHDWGSYSFKIYHGLFMALQVSGTNQRIGGTNFLWHFSAEPGFPFFEGESEHNSVNIGSSPCRFTPAPEDPGN